MYRILYFLLWFSLKEANVLTRCGGKDDVQTGFWEVKRRFMGHCTMCLKWANTLHAFSPRPQRGSNMQQKASVSQSLSLLCVILSGTMACATKHLDKSCNLCIETRQYKRGLCKDAYNIYPFRWVLKLVVTRQMQHVCTLCADGGRGGGQGGLDGV